MYLHAGSWKSAHTVRRGYELNIPLQVILNPVNENLPENPPLSAGKEGLGMSFLDLSAENLILMALKLDLSAENLILMALKPSEDDPQQLILRCYECHGETAELSLQSDLGLNLGDKVDLLERSSTTEFSSGQQILTIQPWKIASFKVSPAINPRLE